MGEFKNAKVEKNSPNPLLKRVFIINEIDKNIQSSGSFKNEYFDI